MRQTSDDDQATPTRFLFADAEFLTMPMELRVRGKLASNVQPQSLAILQTLLRQAGRIVDKETLMVQSRCATDTTLKSSVYKLRQALGGEAGKRIIKTIERVGYIIDIDVRRELLNTPATSSDLSQILNADSKELRQLMEGSEAGRKALKSVLVDSIVAGMSIGMLEHAGSMATRAGLKHTSENIEARLRIADPEAAAETHVEIGRHYYRLSSFQEAIGEYQKAIDILEPLQTNRNINPVLALARLRLATVLADLHQKDKALQLIDSVNANPDHDPTEIGHPLSQAFALARLKILTATEHFPQAIFFGRRLVSLTEADSNLPIEPRHSANFILGSVLYRVGEWDEAEAIFNKLLEPPFTAIGEARTARARINLARVNMAQRKLDDVESNLIQARDTLIEIFGKGEQGIAAAEGELAAYFEFLGDFRQAKEAFQRAYENYVISPGPDSAPAMITLLNIAIDDLNLGDAAKAFPKLQQARKWIVEHMDGGTAGGVAQVANFHRARAHNSLGRPNKALSILMKLEPARMAEVEVEADWPWRLQAEQGRALLALGKDGDARKLLATALIAMESNGTAAWIKDFYRRL